MQQSSWQMSIKTPFGSLVANGVGEHGKGGCEAITQVDLLPTAIAHEDVPSQKLARQLKSECEAFFDDPQHVWQIPIHYVGTRFQQTVWRHLLAIPVGTVETYGEVAKRIQSAPRAVGGACRRNPIALIVPCHRVVAQSGLGGYSGDWQSGKAVSVKHWLLRHEGVSLSN